MKPCICCKQIKPLSGYYTHKEMGDGHLNKCIECVKEYTRKRHMENARDEQWIEQQRERHRDKYHRLGYKEKHKPTPEGKREIMRRYAEKYPEKMSAQSARIPIVKGKEAHHWSYCHEHRTDVIYLTNSEHNTLHRFIRYDQSVFMYRDLEGNLLDTRSKHEQYAMKVLGATR